MNDKTETPFRCRICAAEGAFKSFRVKEMMFGIDEKFSYRLCQRCGCLQIETIPEDLARHYGNGYYSYAPRMPREGLAGAIERARNRHLSGQDDVVGRVVAKLKPYAALAALAPLKLPLDTRIVDVGCGGGELLLALQSAGFTKLLGIDPFIKRDLELGGGLDILKQGPQSLPKSSCDLVMLHHSLEHIPDQQATLAAVRAALVPGGRAVVRIPTVSSHAWRRFGTHWVALDAPRHLYLHSRESIQILAEDCGLIVESIHCDSNEFQFWGSEQYRRGIPLMRDGERDIRPKPGLFSAQELRAMRHSARELNRKGQGDQIVVHMLRR